MTEIFFLGLVVVVPLAIYAARLIQQVRVEKARRVADLTHRYKMIHGIVAGIPPQYLSRELTIFTLQEAIAVLGQLRRETPRDNRIRLALGSKQELLTSISNDFNKPQSMPLGSVQVARTVRARLISLRSIISVKVNKNQLDPTDAKKHIQFINWQAIRCVTDILMARAQTLRVDHNYRLALHTYNAALKEFERLPNHEKAVMASESCQLRIDETEAELAAHAARIEEENAQRIEAEKKERPEFRQVWEEQFASAS